MGREKKELGIVSFYFAAVEKARPKYTLKRSSCLKYIHFLGDSDDAGSCDPVPCNTH